MNSEATALPLRMFTTHGTVLFVDPASGELRHGPLDSSPANARLVVEGRRCRIMHETAGSVRPIGFRERGAWTLDGEEPDAATEFELFRTRLYARWVGLRASGKFLSAVPDGRLDLAVQWWRAWESFLLSEPLPDDAGGARGRNRPSLGLTCIETRDITNAVRAVERTVQCILPDCLYWFSNSTFPSPLPGVEIIHIAIPHFTHYPDDINRLCLRTIPQVVTTDFNLTVQADGFAVNPQAWDDYFWDYDYIGGAWPLSSMYGPFPLVGNGGFSLRSRKLYNALLDIPVKWRVEDWSGDQRLANDSHYNPKQGWIPEDLLISLWYREILEERYGIRFCPPELANKFSVSDIEHPSTRYWLGHSFGFHGRFISHHYGVNL